MPNNNYSALSPEYDTGIKALDDQHKVLVNTLNRLSDAVSKNEGDKVIVGILDALISYTRTHFVLEERLMQQANYKNFESHKKKHQILSEQLDRFHEKNLSNDGAIYQELIDFLKAWLTEHIQSEDSKYGATLKQAGFSVVQWEREASAEFNLKLNENKPWWKFWNW